jgi:hypothetical protein
MNTQSHLFENSDKIPEQLYVELMNTLKKDFENTQQPRVIIINRTLPSHIACSKLELVRRIMEKSVDWEDREEVLVEIVGMDYRTLKLFCDYKKIGTMKPNPRFVTQQQQQEERGSTPNTP